MKICNREYTDKVKATLTSDSIYSPFSQNVILEHEDIYYYRPSSFNNHEQGFTSLDKAIAF